MIITVFYTMPTEWIGAVWEDEREFDTEDFDTEEEMQEAIQDDFEEWREEIIDSLISTSDWEY